MNWLLSVIEEGKVDWKNRKLSPISSATEEIKDWVDWVIKRPNWELKFNDNLRLIEESFLLNELAFTPTYFSIWENQFDVAGRLNSGSVKALAYASYVANLTVWETLEIFSECYSFSIDNPQDKRYRIVNALMEFPEEAYVRDVVTFWASPLKTFRV
jgi:hypothetical protein